MEDLSEKKDIAIEAKTEEIESVKPTDSATVSNMKKNPVKSMTMGVIIALALGVVIGSGVLISMARSGSNNPLATKAASFIRVAVARVNDNPILYSDYSRDLASLKKFYSANPQSAGQVSDEQASDQVLSRLIANTLIAEAAKEFDVTIDDSDMEASKKDLMIKFNNDEQKLTEDIKNNFDLSLDEFYSAILYPSVLQDKLAKQFADSTGDKGKEFMTEQVHARHILFEVTEPKDDAKVKQKATKVLNRIKAGEDFAKLAKEFGSDGTKEQGGDLGWFGKGAMVPEFEAAAFELKAGELSNSLVKTNFGYHIIKVDEKKTIRDFDGFMKDKLQKAVIVMTGKIHNPFEALQKATQ